MMIERFTISPAETARLASALAKSLVPGDILALHGDLGAGKTCFVRGLAQGLRADPLEVSSPTFVLLQEYETISGLTLVHIDAYRIGPSDDLESIGWSELLQDRETVVAIEWPERLGEQLPADRVVDVTIDHLGGDQRRLEFTAPASMQNRLVPVTPRSRPCPACATSVAIDRPTAPFCSDRCRLVDLGDWFDERHRISRPIEAADDEMFD